MRKVLVLLRSDPRTSPRAAEAVRVADGLSHGEELDLSLLIDGEAATAFAAPEHEWIEGSSLLKHLFALKARQVPLYLHACGSSEMLEQLPLQPVDAVRAEALKRENPVVIEF